MEQLTFRPMEYSDRFLLQSIFQNASNLPNFSLPSNATTITLIALHKGNIAGFIQASRELPPNNNTLKLDPPRITAPLIRLAEKTFGSDQYPLETLKAEFRQAAIQQAIGVMTGLEYYTYGSHQPQSIYPLDGVIEKNVAPHHEPVVL
ncbi:MAG: hypothetical protein IAE63_03130 [Alphaproteobacteria bacterium]|jgi:hypothetical protein|nr:hypothetical protein [Alphaproteobacteria bacterium]